MINSKGLNSIYLFVYTMEDMFDAEIQCNKCGSKTQKSYVIKSGFKVRTWHCINCGKVWYHPGDMENFEKFKELKKKDYEVKLREVGNSWIVSIPKEIIRFQEISKSKVISLSLDDPGTVILKFKAVRKVY